jgi:hypothetical protein
MPTIINRGCTVEWETALMHMMMVKGLCLWRVHTVRRIIDWLKHGLDYLGSLLYFLVLIFRLKKEQRKRKRDQHTKRKEETDRSDDAGA